MGKYIQLAATHMNWGMICRDRGEWLNTKYVVYSDGTCWKVSKYDEQPYMQSPLRGIVSEQEYYELRQKMSLAKTFRMDEEAFGKLKDVLENQFDKADAVMGCDGDGWEMHHYSPSGRLLHSVRGHIYGVPALEEIEKLLEKH